ncbi:MAG: arylsulfatase [Fuerstiella sp.]|nr:arylsulfatase [Fuerstiella sp.]
MPLRSFVLLLLCSCLLNGVLSNPAGAQTGLVDATKNGVTEGDVLPFRPPPSTSVAGQTLQSSTMQRRQHPQQLAADAPNILIVLIDDVGFGVPSTFGGFAETPTLSRVASQGISYNRFHTTSICSPTRASLLTGRNHHRVGSGTIAERAVDWDGYTGIIPQTSATLATVLRNYGYKTSAFGKWHNSPADQTTAMGPFTYWPNAYGFDYFYGFLAGETSQYEPRLVENRNVVEPPHDEKYHLSEDLAERAITWMKQHQSYSPDQPFLMYWAPGAAHGPHQIFHEWADRYSGRFDQGWDELRQEIFSRQKALGWIPEDTQLTERAGTMDAWNDIPAAQRSFQTRLMEVFAGYVEHVDAQVGKLIDHIDATGQRDNTLIFYIWGDNGSSAEGQRGSISELLAQNQIPNTVEQQIKALKEIGGIEKLGTAEVDNMYHAGWAWAGSTPFHHTKLVASHFGGTRNPLVVSWPKKIRPNRQPRDQFYHVNDIVPTIYDLLNIPHPEQVDGFHQDPIDGVSMAKSLFSSDAPENKHVQYFENNGSRGIYQDGWYACAFGPLIPWKNAQQGLGQWDSRKDHWELYNLHQDFSQARNVADTYPEKLQQLQTLFLQEAQANQVFPVGAGIWLRIHPEDVLTSPYRSWVFDQTTFRMPEFAAPGLGKKSNSVLIDAEFTDDSSGVLYALGGAGGGLTCYVKDGYVYFEYNLMIIKRFRMKSVTRLSAGSHQIQIDTTIRNPGAPANIVMTIDGTESASLETDMTVPGVFSASESFDVGVDLGSVVSRDYMDSAPFRFNGTIEQVHVQLK